LFDLTLSNPTGCGGCGVIGEAALGGIGKGQVEERLAALAALLKGESQAVCGKVPSGAAGKHELWLGSNPGKTRNWSRGPDLNRGPADYESAALPTELPRPDQFTIASAEKHFQFNAPLKFPREPSVPR